jgi:hypothetical protein
MKLENLDLLDYAPKTTYDVLRMYWPRLPDEDTDYPFCRLKSLGTMKGAKPALVLPSLEDLRLQNIGYTGRHGVRLWPYQETGFGTNLQSLKIYNVTFSPGWFQSTIALPQLQSLRSLTVQQAGDRPSQTRH